MWEITYNADIAFVSKSRYEIGEFNIGIRQGLEKLRARFCGQLNLLLVNIKTIFFYLKKQFVSFLVTLPYFIPYLLK